MTSEGDDSYVAHLIAEEEAALAAERRAREEADASSLTALMQAYGTCQRCGVQVGPESVMSLEHCDHRFCSPCLRAAILGALNSIGDRAPPSSGTIEVLCPLAHVASGAAGASGGGRLVAGGSPCQCVLSPSEIKQSLSATEFEAFTAASFERLFTDSESFVRCANATCRVPIERVSQPAFARRVFPQCVGAP